MEWFFSINNISYKTDFAPIFTLQERTLGFLSTLAIPEFAPFAFTLARRMASLLAEGKVTPSSALWRVGIEGVLLRLVDSETEAHEEILRLLLAAAPSLDPGTLGRYLDTTLANSRRSRKAHKNRYEEDGGLPPLGYGPESGWGGGGDGGMYSLTTGDLYGDWFTHEGWREGAEGAKGRGADGVRGTYALFLGKQPELNDEMAPELFAYLDATTSGEGA